MIASRRARACRTWSCRATPVFRWASFAMAKIGQQALDRAGVSVDDLDVLRAAPGQHAHHRRDGARHEAAPSGSGSPATSPSRATPRPPPIPLALDRMIDEGDARSGDTALLIAFGAGLAYAAQVVTVP